MHKDIATQDYFHSRAINSPIILRFRSLVECNHSITSNNVVSADFIFAIEIAALNHPPISGHSEKVKLTLIKFFLRATASDIVNGHETMSFISSLVPVTEAERFFFVCLCLRYSNRLAEVITLNQHFSHSPIHLFTCSSKCDIFIKIQAEL